MLNENDKKRVAELLESLFDEEDMEVRESVVNDILQIDPDNPVAKYLKWESLDDEDAMENLGLLREAVDTMRPAVENASEEMDEGMYATYVAMLSDLSSSLYFKGEKDAALDIAQEFMDLDKDGFIIGRVVYYAALIENAEYAKAVEAADSDMYETPMSEYCRAIALFEQEGASEDASDALLQAISLDPDMVFFITGLWTFDEEDLEQDDESGYIEDMMIQVSVLMELWSASEERLAFLSAVVFAFGYLTGRVTESEDMQMLEDGYKNLGCLNEMSEAKDTLHAMIASGKEQEEVDEEALMIFREMRSQGIFS